MKKLNLDIEQSVRALFALSGEVSNVLVHGIPYVYFKPVRRGDARIIRYILKSNGIQSELHNTRYYDNYGSKRLIVRTSRENLSKQQKFKKLFDEMYQDRNNLADEYVLKQSRSPRFFGLWSESKKTDFINMMADKTR